MLTPTVALYEVYKWIKRERTEEEALAAVATMQKTRIVPLTDEVALAAADLSLANRLAMADAIMAYLADPLSLFAYDRSLSGVWVDWGGNYPYFYDTRLAS